MECGGIDEGDPASKTSSSEYRHHRSSPLGSEVVLITGINVFAHLNDPIPIDDDDDDTLPQLLSKPITDFFVKLGKCTQKLSDVFPYLPEDHLHIIVKLPGKWSFVYGRLTTFLSGPLTFSESRSLHAFRRFNFAFPVPLYVSPVDSSASLQNGGPHLR